MPNLFLQSLISPSFFHRVISFVLGLLCMVASFFSYADDADAFVQKLALLDTFQGRFEQTLIDDKGNLLQESAGVFFLKRPGYFYWDTQTPFPQLVVTDLNTIQLYDPDLQQMTVHTVDTHMSATPALLLSGDLRKIKQHYHVVQQSAAHYLLTPIVPQELFVSLSVELSDEQLSSMSLADALGQVTRFQFINGVYNQMIDPSVFEFTPPAGTDIIREK